MVLHPIDGWLRVGKAYNARETAKGWLGFVRSAWRGCRVKVLSCPLTWKDGKLDAASVRRLDVQFNMDASDSPPNVKEHATLSARARVDHGVEVKTTEDHENRAADRGCVSRLVLLLHLVRGKSGQTRKIILKHSSIFSTVLADLFSDPTCSILLIA
jgi:hypothetical protein